MKTKKEQRKKEKKQTSIPQDLVPKKDAKGGWGSWRYVADRRAAAGAVGLNPGPLGEQRNEAQFKAENKRVSQPPIALLNGIVCC